jgi:hypothetical protein
MRDISLRLLGAAKRTAIRLSYQNYYSAKAYHLLLLHLSNLGKNELILVYQMGKVGSTTVRVSLRAAGLDVPVRQIHFLSQDIIDENERILRKRFPSVKRGFLYRHLWECQYLRKQVDKGLKGRRWRVVTLTRDPIARNISAFFQTLQVQLLDSGRRCKIKSWYGFEITIDIEDIECLVDLFLEKWDHDTPLVYFDRELKGVLGIDVFSREFSTSKGYQIYREEPADVLLIRLENLSQCAQDAFGEFLNIDGFTLVRANVSSDKAYHAIYQKFLDSVVLPDSYVDRMYTSKYAQHFYSEEEIDLFRARWRGESVAS